MTSPNLNNRLAPENNVAPRASMTYEQVNAPPVLPTPTPPPAVEKLQSATSGDLAILRAGADQFAGILRELRATLNSISGDSDSSPSKMWRLSSEAKTAANDSLTRAMQGFEAAIARVRSAALAAQSAPINPDATVSELQLSTALSFVREVFGAANGNPGQSDIDTLMRMNLPGMVQALRTYVPVYVSLAWKGDQSMQRATTKALNAQIDLASKPSEAPLYTAARDLLDELAQGESRLKVAYQQAQNEAQSGITTRTGFRTLPGWTKGALIQVTPEGM